MAKNARKILAWVLVLTLLTGQLAIPAAAEETEDPATVVEVTVEASSVPEEPAAESQAPAASDSVSVSTSESSSSSGPSSSEGITEHSSSSTTTWSGSEDGTSISGSETTTTVTGTDDVTGQTMYEGGNTSGSESSVTTSDPVADSSTQEGYVTKEVDTTVENSSTETGEASTTESSSSTETGTWSDTENGYTEGKFEADKTVQKKETSSTEILGEEVLPENGVTIGLTADQNKSNPNKGIYTFTGTAGGEVIALEEGVSIPEGATLVKDKDGNVVGYKLETSKETITGTETKEGKAQLDAGNSHTDTTGSTASVTPDLDTAAEKLNVRIDDNTQIDEETNEGGDVVAYVITNKSEQEREISAMDELERPEAGSFPQADGSTITRTVEETQDADGNAVVNITEVKTDASGKELSRSQTTQTITLHDLPVAEQNKVVYTLPEKPAGSVDTTEDGITTTVTVTDILDSDGKVIGYKSTTIRTDAAGAELYREENDLYGTEETINETITSANPKNTGAATVKTTVVETSRITAEETTFEDIATYTRLNQIVNNMTVDKTNEVVMIDGKLYYIYTGSVTVSEGKNHGDTSLMNPITPMSTLFNENEALDLDLGGDIHAKDPSTPADGFKYIGHGIDSALSVNKTYGSASANQFRLKSSDGKTYFALCIDFETSIQAGHLYDIEDIDDADYLNDTTAEKIRSIALNGYWGTASGIGSMSDVQELLVNYLTTSKNMTKAKAENIANSLTPGQALAATQAALWTYGDSGSNNPVQVNNLISNRDNNSTDEINAEYLYNALIAAANTPNTQTNAKEGVEFLDAEDITATSIVVKEKIASAGDEGNTTGKNVYNTDLNFTLGIEPTKLFGDLKVTVYDGSGKEVKTVILANKDTTLIGLKPDNNGMYTISDIELAEGVNVNLKLHGTQDLGTGVYIYTSLDGKFNDSQTLVTLATGSRTVDLDISMKLDVQEPTVTKEVSGSTQYGTRTDTQKQSKTHKTTRKSTTTKSQWKTVTTDSTDSSLVYTSNVTLDSISTKQTKEEKSWSFSWMKTYDPEPAPQDDDYPVDDNGDDPGAPKNTKLKKTINIFDELVPLAKAPKTGDLSGLWIAISGLSLGGMALLNAKRKEEE